MENLTNILSIVASVLSIAVILLIFGMLKECIKEMNIRSSDRELFAEWRDGKK